jgi:hypothetical protein
VGERYRTKGTYGRLSPVSELGQGRGIVMQRTTAHTSALQ